MPFYYLWRGQTSPNCVQDFPYNYYKTTFDREAFSKSRIHGSVPFEDVDEALTEVEETIRPKVQAINKVSAYFGGFFVASGIIGTLLHHRSSRSKNAFFTRAVVIADAVIMGFITIQYYQFLGQKEREIQNLAQKVVNRYKIEFQYRGLQWNIPDQFPKYLELLEDTTYKIENKKN